jgi:hypothetical protein
MLADPSQSDLPPFLAHRRITRRTISRNSVGLLAMPAVLLWRQIERGIGESLDDVERYGFGSSGLPTRA